MYSINHRRDAAAANAKTARRRVAVEDDEDAPPDVAEALPPQVTCVCAWITAGRTDLPDGCSCWTSQRYSARDITYIPMARSSSMQGIIRAWMLELAAISIRSVIATCDGSSQRTTPDACWWRGRPRRWS